MRLEERDVPHCHTSHIFEPAVELSSARIQYELNQALTMSHVEQKDTQQLDFFSQRAYRRRDYLQIKQATKR